MPGTSRKAVYTHYFEIADWDAAGWQAIWRQLVDDARLIMEACDIILTGPTHSADTITPPIASAEEGIAFNGVGEYGHEPFFLSKQNSTGSVGTARKPYDLAVCCVLLRAHYLSPMDIKIDPDGRWDDARWQRVRELYQTLWQGDNVAFPPWWDANMRSPDLGRAQTSWYLDSIPKQYKSDSTSTECRARPARPSSLTSIDLNAIKVWLHACEENPDHGSCHESLMEWQNFPGVQFRLIDVYKRCIVAIPEGCTFAALSYVWGGIAQPRLTTANVRTLSQERGLEGVWDEIPTTILDAIILCERIGERYLWVDALCILQDSTRDTRLQILRMRRIYSAARFTIAAVSAPDADGGLLPSPVSGAAATVCHSVDELNSLLEASPWGGRGWCYQERALSHRAIMFTSSGVFMQCQKAIVSTGGVCLQMEGSKTASGSSRTVGGLLAIPHGQGLEYFVSAVEHYSKCSFTDSSDKISAFQAVFQRYEGMMDGRQSVFHYGLPTCAFDQAFCWRTELHYPGLRNPHFPSWSWLGWDCGATFDRDLLKTTRTNQMAGGGYDGSITRFKVTQPGDKVRKPCQLAEFGFPASFSSSFYNIPFLSVLASTTDLFISSKPERQAESNGLYAVFPTHCGHMTIPPMSARLLSNSNQTEVRHDVGDHDTHGDCEAKRPMGYIWLDRAWRESQPEEYFMEFMALSGHLDPEHQGQWVINMLMCLLGRDGMGRYGRYERLQVMDCSISEANWIKIGGMTNFITIH